MKKVVLALLAAVSVTAHAEAGRYVATDADTSVSALVSRWAALDGRTIKWEATGELPLHDAARLNATAKLGAATNLDDAFGRVAKLAHERTPDAPVLFACAYTHGAVTLEIREAGQP